MMKKYVTEFIATFFLALTICLVGPLIGGRLAPFVFKV
jgi:hypothetical protein